VAAHRGRNAEHRPAFDPVATLRTSYDTFQLKRLFYAASSASTCRRCGTFTVRAIL
jgi:hypothetical protein